MTGIKISELPVASTLTGAELIPVVQSGATSQTTINGIPSSAIAYTQGGTGAATTTVQSKLRESVSVKDFGAVGDGVTDDTAAIQAAFNVGGSIIFPDGLTYLVNSGITVNTDCDIDLQNSTIKRGSLTGVMINVASGGKFSIRNGTLDGNNTAANGGHILYYGDTNGDLEMSSLNVINNCVGYPTPTLSQDTDLVYVLRGNSVRVDNCNFTLASRQGISFTGAVKIVSLSNNLFKDCYLFGVDIEPNTPTTFMYEEVTITGNIFRNCGPKSPPTNYVWNSGGPFQMASGASATVTFVKDVVFSGNTIESTDFLNPNASYVEPFMRFDQFKSLVFSGNIVDNLSVTNFAPFGTGTIEQAQITGNVWTRTGTQENSISLGELLLRSVVTGNRLHYAYVRSPTAIFNGNTFKDSALTEGIHCFSTCTNAVISDNFFDGITTCISVADKSSGYTITGNRATGYTTFIGTVTSSQLMGNIDNKMQGPVTVQSTTVSVPTGVATTVFDLAGVKQSGMICVYDAGGTRLGSYALYANFYDGSNNVPLLTSVSNSTVYGCALTLSGNAIQFAHTYGSTRTVTVSVIRFP